MKKENEISIIIIVGTIILGLLTYIGCKSIQNSKKKVSYYAVAQLDVGKIYGVATTGSSMEVNVSSSITSVCIKSTKSNPSVNSVCWQTVKDGTLATSVFKNKNYYIWLMDAEKNISSPVMYNYNSGKLVKVIE